MQPNDDDLRRRESRLRAQIIQSDRALQSRLLTNPGAAADPAVEARIRELEATIPRYREARRRLDARRELKARDAQDARRRRLVRDAFRRPVARPVLAIRPL